MSWGAWIAVSVLAIGCTVPAQSGPPPAVPPPAEEPADEPAIVEQVAPEPPPGALGSEEGAYQHLLSTYRVGFYRPRHKDGRIYAPSDGYLAPVARTSDGGFVFGGQLEVDGASKPVLGKIDGDGAMLWHVAMDRPVFRAYEGGLINETPDGNYVGFVMSYRNPALFPVQSFAKIAPDGSVLWKLELPIDADGNTAQIHLARVTDDGSIELSGHHYLGPRTKKDRPANRWTARLTADGELTDVAIGAPLDWAKDEW